MKKVRFRKKKMYFAKWNHKVYGSWDLGGNDHEMIASTQFTSVMLRLSGVLTLLLITFIIYVLITGLMEIQSKV